MKKKMANRRKNKNAKVKMVNNLCICIIGKDKEEFLKECIESSLKLSRSVTYFDLGSADRSIEVAEQKGISVVKGEPPLADDQLLLEQPSKSDWILFLRPDEKPIFKSNLQFNKIGGRKSAQGYSLVVKSTVDPESLEDFQWMKVTNQYKDAKHTRYVVKIEIRLVRRQYFSNFASLLATSSQEVPFAFESDFLTEVQIESCKGKEHEKQGDDDKDKEREIKYLKGEIECGPEEVDQLSELGDDYLTFSVITKDDLARYYNGISMGFGSERMYLTMLHYLSKFGNFEEARDLFETWKSQWEFFDTPQPYRLGGIIYAYLLDMDKAVGCFEKYLELIPEDQAGEVLPMLAKVYMLQGKKEAAVALLKRSLEVSQDGFNKLLIETVEKDNWRPATLSVCMIARDEEANIRRALESVAGIAEEIIVVDTGSIDNTKEVVREFNGKIVDAVWENDFSKARNLGLQEATGDYVLCLDADEFIDSRERTNLALVKQILPVERDVAYRIRIETEEEDEEMVVMLRLPKTNQAELAVRLFPAFKEIHYEGKAFESVESSIRALGIKIQETRLFKIVHSVSNRMEREKRKASSMLAAFDSISEPWKALEGAICFLRLGQLDTALRWLEKARINDPQLLAKIVSVYVAAGQAPGLVKVVDKAMEEFHESVELSVAKAEVDFSRQEYAGVYNILGPCMETARETMGREDCARASYLYGMALLETGYMEEGIEYLIDARGMDPWNLRYKVGGLYGLSKGDAWEGAIGVIDEISREQGLDFAGTINDFADLGLILTKLSGHFAGRNMMESADLCRKIVENIIQYKISEKEEVEKISGYLNTLEFAEEDDNEWQ